MWINVEVGQRAHVVPNSIKEVAPVVVRGVHNVAELVRVGRLWWTRRLLLHIHIVGEPGHVFLQVATRNTLTALGLDTRQGRRR